MVKKKIKEADVVNFLAENPSVLGKNYKIISKEYHIGKNCGVVDLVFRNRGKIVLCEVKTDRKDSLFRAPTQIRGYLDCYRKKFPDEKVEGLIVITEPNATIKSIVKEMSDVALKVISVDEKIKNGEIIDEIGAKRKFKGNSKGIDENESIEPSENLTNESEPQSKLNYEERVSNIQKNPDEKNNEFGRSKEIKLIREIINESENENEEESWAEIFNIKNESTAKIVNTIGDYAGIILNIAAPVIDKIQFKTKFNKNNNDW